LAIKAIQGNGFVKGNGERNDFRREKRKSRFIIKNCEDKEGDGGKNNKFQREGKSLFKK